MGESNALQYGVLTYDVTGSKSAYKRIRQVLRGKSIMQTWSCYIIPWGFSGRLTDALNEENQKVGSSVRFRILPYANEAADQVKQECDASLRRLLEDQRKKLDLAIHEFEEGMDDDPSIPTKAIKAMKKRVDEAKMCQAAFTLSNNFLHALAGYETVIQAIRVRMDEELKRKAEAEAKSREKTGVPENA